MKQSRGRAVRRKAILYSLIPIAGVISPLLVLPSITGAFSTGAWVSIAIGQSLALAGATLIELGWGLSGPQRVAGTLPRKRGELALLSLLSRLLLFAPIAGATAVLAFVVSPMEAGNAALVAVATLTNALGFTWFFLGMEQPRLVLLTDTLPKLFGLLLVVVLIQNGSQLWVYATVGIAIPSLFSVVLGSVIIFRSSPTGPIARYTFRRIFWTVRTQLSALVTRLMSAFYTALPVSIVGLIAPGHVAIFAAGERLMRIGLSALIIVPNALQGYVGSVPAGVPRLVKVRVALVANLALGLFAALVFGFLAPVASSIIFSGEATIPSTLAWIFAVVVLVVCTSRATGGIALVAVRRVRTLALSASVGAVVGIPAVVILSAPYGAAGGATGVLIAEIVVLVVQLFGLRGSGLLQSRLDR